MCEQDLGGAAMNGAESLVHTLSDNGIEVCFANPGTSEMHFVAALESVPKLKPVLALFEGVATGAADGYYRIAGKPAATLLHLGPGIGNGFANLHNARKARSGIINIVGDHATGHAKLETPLKSDTAGLAKICSDKVVCVEHAGAVSEAALQAIEAARVGRLGAISTMVLPADTAWGCGIVTQRKVAPVQEHHVSSESIDEAVAILMRLGEKACILLGHAGTSEAAQRAALEVSRLTGCGVYFEFYNARLPQGKGRPNFPRIPYAVDAAVNALKPYEALVLAGALDPAAFFAYPNKPSYIFDPKKRRHCLAKPHEEVELALAEVLEQLRGRAAHMKTKLPESKAPRVSVKTASTKWGPAVVAATVARLLPEQAIVIDESISSGRDFAVQMAHANPHDWLAIMGGAIGFGLPAALGAGVAAPDRQVVVLEGDGSGMYTLQALWSIARESLPVVIIIFANRDYAILRGECMNVGATAIGSITEELLSLKAPKLDWAKLAQAQGVPSASVQDEASLTVELKRAFAAKSPYLIEVLV